jgi:hypothetical protein
MADGNADEWLAAGAPLLPDTDTNDRKTEETLARRRQRIVILATSAWHRQ